MQEKPKQLPRRSLKRSQATEPVQIGEMQVNYLRLLVPEPVDVGTDDAGVYERVIWVDIYYERND